MPCCALSSPIGIERLCREQAEPLLEAYHEGALALDTPFAVWGAIALDRPDPADVDRALDRGCVGISLPAGALAGVDQLLGAAAAFWTGWRRAARRCSSTRVPGSTPPARTAADRLPSRCGGLR